MEEPEAETTAWMEEVPDSLYQMLSMAGPTSPEFPQLPPPSRADLEVEPDEPKASGEEQVVETESYEHLTSEEIFTKLSSQVTLFTNNPAMCKLQRDINPIAAEVQKIALLFCEPSTKKDKLLEDMKNAVDKAVVMKTAGKMFSLRTMHVMADMLKKILGMMAELAQRWCQSSKNQIQLLQTEVNDLTALACDKVTNQQEAEDILQPRGMNFLQPSFMQEELKTELDPEASPSPPKSTPEAPPPSVRPTPATSPSGPATSQDYSHRIPRHMETVPLTFDKVVDLEEALLAVKDMTNFAEDIVGRVMRAVPSFQRLLADNHASGKIKAEVFRNITSALHIKGTPKDLLDRADHVTGKPITSSNMFPPIVDLRPTNEYLQTNKTFNYIFDASSKIYLRNRLITVVLSLTSAYATASVMTLVASGHPYLKTLFNTEEKNPWVGAFRYSVIQSCIFSLENTDKNVTITNNSQLFLQTDLSAPNFQNAVRSTRHIHWPTHFEEHFAPQDNSKPMSRVDILHNREISFVRSSLQIRPAKRQRIQKRK